VAPVTDPRTPDFRNGGQTTLGTGSGERDQGVIEMTKHMYTQAGFMGTAALVATMFLTAASADAASARAHVDDDVLFVQGSGGDDRLALRLAAGSPNTLEVDFDDDGSAEASFDRSTFTQIVVMLAGGDDQYRVDQVNGAFADEAITVDGGGGDDVMNGGDGAELFLGRGGSDFADGNRGIDTAFLHGGNDTFRWDPGDGSDVVEGGGGTDSLDFRGAPGPENMSLSAVGSRSLFFRQQGNISMDMNDVELLDLTALGGIDTFTLNDMRGTGFLQADVDLSVGGNPDGAEDTVTIKGTEQADQVDVDTAAGGVVVDGLQTQLRITGSEPTDHLRVDTLEGDDSVDVGNAVATLIDVDVDLGTDEI
jgi:hypothetical protein